MTDSEFDGIELKPCPFCGGEAYMQRYGGTSQFYIMCKKCWLRVEDGFAPTRMPKQALADFFNKRVSE